MRTIKQNHWGNWRGYEAGRFVIEFGTDQIDAEQWRDGKLPASEEDKWAGRGYAGKWLVSKRIDRAVAAAKRSRKKRLTVADYWQAKHSALALRVNEIAANCEDHARIATNWNTRGLWKNVAANLRSAAKP